MRDEEEEKEGGGGGGRGRREEKEEEEEEGTLLALFNLKQKNKISYLMHPRYSSPICTPVLVSVVGQSTGFLRNP